LHGDIDAFADTLRNLQPKEVSGGEGMSAEEMTERAASDILHVLPPPLDQRHIAATLVPFFSSFHFSSPVTRAENVLN
jgi:hypothetical protein